LETAQGPGVYRVLNSAKKSGLFAVYFHVEQVLWLNDQRTIDFLVDLLPEEDSQTFFGEIFRKKDRARQTGMWALSFLNRLESGRLVVKREWHSAQHFRKRKNDPDFREMMVAAIHQAVEVMHQGR
jgi:hypothetical protein